MKKFEIIKAETKEDCEIETSKAIMEMRNHIAELENENAELKAYNEKLLDGDIEKHNKIVELQAEVISLKNKCRQYENGYAYEKLYELRVQVENKLDEVQRFLNMGLKGVKIHPDTQLFNMDDERMFELYDFLQQTKTPILCTCLFLLICCIF